MSNQKQKQKKKKKMTKIKKENQRNEGNVRRTRHLFLKKKGAPSQCLLPIVTIVRKENKKI